MARYNNEDQRNLEELIEEGLWDRMKARGSQAVGAVRGAGQQLKGGVQQAAGNVVQGAGNLAAKGVQAVGGTIDPANNKLAQAGQNLQQQGQQNIQTGGQQGNIAKLDSYKNSAAQKIQNMVADIQNDLNKLGIQIQGNKFEQFSKSMTTSLIKAIDLFKDAPTQQAPAQQAPAQQAPVV